MAARFSEDSKSLEPFDLTQLSLDEEACKTPPFRFRYVPKFSLSCANSNRSSPETNESTTSSTYVEQAASDSAISRRTRKSGFATKLPPMGIFWDIENVRVPKFKSTSAVVQKIRSVFLEDYREAEFIVVCDVKKENSQIIQELHDSQINLIHVSSMSKNAADEKLKQSLRRFADVHPAPSAILLISSDINFASDLSDLRYRKKIRIILVHNVNVADALVLCANEHHLFVSLTEDLPVNSTNRPLELNSFCLLTINNLPKNADKVRVKNRLKFLTNNCGGKFVDYYKTDGVATFRFGNYDSALRAQKRIQGEDVFGQKIKVLAPSMRSYSGQRVKNDRSLPQLSFNNNNTQYVAPPPGFDTRQYPYNSRKFPNMRTPPILDRSCPPNFRPIKMGPSPCVSPMEMGYDQVHAGFNRSRGQDALAQAAAALPSFARVHHTSGSSEFSDGYISNQPVDLNITNLDATIDVKELRKLLTNMIKQYAMILNLNVVLQADGTPVANLKVSSQQEAQFIISQLHRQKLGHKRIVIGYEQNNAPDPEQLKVMVISILQDAPDKRMPLFKFMELLESRYHCTVSVSEVNKLKEVVRIVDERGSRMVSLTEEGMRTSPNGTLALTMLPHCVIHCPQTMQNIGWCELNSSFIPNIMVSLSTFSLKLLTLLNVHFGTMPLLSFQTCYEQEYHEPLPVNEAGVPLEHLIACVPNVEIKLVGPNKSIKVIQHDIKPVDDSEDQVLKTVASPLAPNVNLLCREVVDLLKNMERCQILLTKFIPAYHHHFGRQCRVADYGFTKLLDLFEAINHVVQIMGDGYRRVITLTHSAQVRRFTSDLLRVLKVQPNKQIAVQEFASAYERALNKTFNPVEYGLCTLDDLLNEIPDNTVVITRCEDECYISVPKREQTAEEVIKTKQFANEVIDLLRHTPYYTMLFNKFVPSYHHHFGHQCKVSDYGFTKLIELFEAIPDVVEIKELSDGDRTVSLTLQQSLKILGGQLVRIIKNEPLKMDDLPVMYFREFGYPLNPQVYQCGGLEEVMDKLVEYVQVVHSNAGSLLRTVEMDTSPSILLVRCWALLLSPPHVKELAVFRFEYRQCYNTSVTMQALENISNVVSLSTMNSTEFISLTSCYVLAAQLYYVICDNGGAIEYNQLERLYEELYRKPLKLSSYNINSVNEFYNKFSTMFYIRGSKKKSVVVLNRNLLDHIAYKYDSEASSIQADWPKNAQSDTSKGAIKKYTPPKPDTPPTPGSMLWWNSPSKFDDQSLNFSINMPITVNPTPLLTHTESLIWPPASVPAIEVDSWRTGNQAPDAHELPMPDKLLAKSGVSDDSGDSGVNILLETSPSDTEHDGSERRGAIKKTAFYGTFLNFK